MKYSTHWLATFCFYDTLSNYYPVLSTMMNFAAIISSIAIQRLLTFVRYEYSQGQIEIVKFHTSFQPKLIIVLRAVLNQQNGTTN